MTKLVRMLMREYTIAAIIIETKTPVQGHLWFKLQH